MNQNFVVYRSSAGSGKTYTLVKEYLRLILTHENPFNYKHILAITFTNKATNEMKERVISALRELANSNGHNYLADDLVSTLHISHEELKQRAERAIIHMLHNYSDIYILTIDKFVYKIARSFALELNLPLNINIELNAADLIEVAVDKLLEGIGKDEGLTKLLMDFVSFNSSKDKSWKVENAIKEMASFLLKESVNYYLPYINKITPEKFREILKQLKVQTKDFEDKVIQNAKEALQLIEKNNISFDSFYFGNAGGVPSYLNKCIQITTRPVKDLVPTARLWKTLNEDKWYSGKASDVDKRGIEHIKAELHQKLISLIQFIEENMAEYALASLLENTIYPTYLLSNVQKSLREISKEFQIVHISEFNKRISEIIEKEPVPFIYERVGEKFHHFLVDEFQDTSVLQWNNLIPLVDESLSKGYFNMLVGDGKQAIYRWRGGEVEQFARLPELISTHHKTTHKHLYQASIKNNFLEKQLTTNYRSKKEVIAFNNYFFDQLKQGLPETLKPVYLQHEQLYNSENNGGYIELQQIEQEDQLGFVKKSILQCLEDGFSLSEIAVLGRTNKQLVELSAFLSEEGISVKSSESLLLNDNLYVQIVISFLDWLIYPDSKEKRTLLIIGFQRLKTIHEDILVHLINDQNALEEFLHATFSLDVHYLIELTLYELAHSILAGLGVDSKNNYVSTLLDVIYAYQQKDQSSIWGFLLYWERKKNALSVQSPENLDAVQLLTIHKSKGLEFPIVILPDMSWNTSRGGNQLSYMWVMNKSNNYQDLKCFLLPLKKELQETIYKDLLEDEEQKEILDNFNLLYVAFTRPEIRLYGAFVDHKGLSKYYQPFIEKSENWVTNDKKFIWGVPLQKDGNEHHTQQIEIPEYMYEKGDWKKKITLSYEHERAKINTYTGYGTLIHTMLTDINEPNDVYASIEKQIQLGTIKLADTELFASNLFEIVKHHKLNTYFQPGLDSINEGEIMLHNGQVIRPDRIVFLKNETICIDYKTGSALKKHETQMAHYKDALTQMGHLNVKGVLIYTEGLEVITV